MKLYNITLRNIKEHPGRFIMLATVLTVAIATVVSLYSISQAMHSDLQDKIDEYGANMVIVPKSKSLPLSYAGVTIGFVQSETKLLTEADAGRIRLIPNSANISVVSPKLLGIVPVADEKAMLAGVRFDDEFKLKQWWDVSSGGRPKKPDEVLLGGKVARVRGFTPGDPIDIKGERFKVAGVLRMVGTQEDDLVYVDLQVAQRILDKPGELSLVEVSAWCKDCPIDDIVAQISDKIPAGKVSAVRQAAEVREAIISQYRLFSLILSVMMATVAVLIIFTNVLSSIRDRRREIGILRAIGYRQTHILYVILLETVFVGSIAGTTGYLVGIAGAGLLAPAVVGIDISLVFKPGFAAAAIGAALLISIAASLYPALKAARLSPAEAIISI